MFTVGMYCSRMMARSVRVGCVVNCTALDLEDFEALPAGGGGSGGGAGAARKGMDKRVRYFHNPSEWDDYDVDYHRLLPPEVAGDGDTSANDDDGEDAGKHRPLAPQAIPEFLRIVSAFLQKSRANNNGNNNHATYIALFDSRGGLGAASYLSACYMCQILRAPVHVALEAVKEGTPLQPLEEREDAKMKKWGLCDWRLMKDLQIRYKGRKEIVVSGGKGGVPSWWWAVEEEEDEEEEDDDDEDNERGTGENIKERINEGDDTNLSPLNDQPKESKSNKRKRNEEEIITIPPYDPSKDLATNNTKRLKMDNLNSSLFPVLPKEILEPVQTDYPKWTRALTVLAQLTQIPSSSSDSDSTPTMTNLPLRPEIDISSQDGNNKNIVNDIASSMKNNTQAYKATWLSTKGRRGLLLILTEAVYFIEQPPQPQSPSQLSAPITVSIVTNIKFPSPQKTSPPKTQHRTLLDVVLVLDNEKSRTQYRFYALDILSIEGGMLWHKPHEQRWRFLNENVLLPRKKEEGRGARGLGHDYAKEPIKIRAKEYFPLQKLGFVMKDVCAGVGHEAKGVRIIPVGVYGVGGDAGSGRHRWCLKKGEEGEPGGNGNDDHDGKNKCLSVVAVIWRQGGELDENNVLSMLL